MVAVYPHPSLGDDENSTRIELVNQGEGDDSQDSEDELLVYVTTNSDQHSRYPATMKRRI